MIKRLSLAAIVLASFLSCFDSGSNPASAKTDTAFEFEFNWYIGENLVGADQVSADSIRFTIENEELETKTFTFDFNKRGGVITGVKQDITVSLQVEVFNKNGEVLFSGQRSQITTAKTTKVVYALHARPPIAPTLSSITDITMNSLKLRWLDNSSWETGYVVERSTGDTSNFSPVAELEPNNAEWLDSTLAPLTTYFYRVYAKNRAGNSGYSTTDSASTLAPPVLAPYDLNATAVSANQIALAWTDNADNEIRFIIQRKIASEAQFDSIAELPANGTTFIDSGLSPATTYEYRILAATETERSPWSAVFSVTTDEAPAAAPEAPTGLEATAESGSGIALSWIDNSENEQGFIIEFRTAEQTAFARLDSVAANATTYIHAGLEAESQYWYRVFAANATGRSSESNVDSATTFADSPTAANEIFARNDALSSNEDDTLTITVDALWANDSFALSYAAAETLTAIIGQPHHGTLSSEQHQWKYVPEKNWAGADSFTYAITADDSISSNTTLVRIAVSAVNDAPLAAKDEYSVKQDNSLDINATDGVLGNDSDVDNQNLTVTLVDSARNGQLSLSSDGGFTYTPDAGFAGADSFSYAVSDGDASDTAWAAIAVTSKDNTSPVAAADSYSIDEDTELSIEVSAGVLHNDEDADGNALTAVLVANAANGALQLSSDGSFTYTPDRDFFGNDSFSYKARDSQGGLSAETKVRLTISAVNDSASFTSVPLTEALEDERYVYTIAATDKEDAAADLRFSMTGKPSWASFADNSDGTATLEGTPLNEHIGEYAVTVKVWDTDKDTVIQQYTITVQNVNDAPVFESSPVTSAAIGQAYSYSISASDEDAGATLTIAGDTIPDWLTFTEGSAGKATLAGTPGNGDLGQHRVVVNVTDGIAETVYQKFTIVIGNEAPAFSSTPITAAQEDAVYTYSFAANDSDPNTTLTFSASLLPSWLTLTNNGDKTGVVTGTPLNQHVGANEVVLTVYDGLQQVTQSFTIEVANTNDAPSFASTAVTSATEDASFRYEVMASDPDAGQALTLTAQKPTWLTFTDNGDRTGLLEGTPPNGAAGDYEIILTATDDSGSVATQTFALTVSDFNYEPVFETISNQSTDEMQPLSLIISATDNDGDALVFSMTGPSDATLTDNNDGTATFYWKPTYSQSGAYSVTFKVTDGVIATPVSKTISITVNNVTEPSVSFSTDESSKDEADYSQTVLVKLSKTWEENITVNLNVGGTATQGSGNDFTLSAASVTINAGATSGSVVIHGKQDAWNEKSETVVLTLSSPSAGVISAPETHTHTIDDDDPMPGGIICVNANVADGGARDGTSWPDAYKSLHDALAAAGTGDTIWIAQGTYITSQTDVTASFEISDNYLKVYGGFLPGETNFNNRNWENNRTILSGQINATDKADKIMNISGLTGVELNGLIFENSATNGVFLFEPQNFSVINCIFQNNYKGLEISAPPISSSQSSIEKCVFYSNSQGLYVSRASANITNCIFYKNTEWSAIGGYEATLNVHNCTIVNNANTGSGAGGIDMAVGFMHMYNSIVYGNTSAEGEYSQLWSANTLKYCNVQDMGEVTHNSYGGYTASGSGIGSITEYGNCIDVLPDFVNSNNAESLPWYSGNAGLMFTGSGGGNEDGSNSISGSPTKDIRGEQRPRNTMDMGAYEQIPVWQ